jgi:hypothetical protein
VASAPAEPRGAVGGAPPRGPAAPRLRVALRPRGRERGGRQGGGGGGGGRRRGEGEGGEGGDGGPDGEGEGKRPQAATSGAAGAPPADATRVGAQQRRALRCRRSRGCRRQDAHCASRPRQASHAGTPRANRSLFRLPAMLVNWVLNPF